MQHLVEQSKIYGNITASEKTELKKSIRKLKSDIDMVMTGNAEFVNDIIAVLIFAHEWKMTELYDLTVKHIRQELLETCFDKIRANYNIFAIKNVVCKKIWRDIFKTVADMNQLVIFGKLWAVKIAHENGCPWDESTCMHAAKIGNLDCLKYAHENGCRWDKQTCMFASMEGHFDCLLYAMKNNCPEK